MPSSRLSGDSVKELNRLLETPMPMQVLRRSRYLIGAFVAAGAFALMSHSDVAAADTYTIKSGETLSAIAAARGVSVNAITAANGLSDSHSITAGKNLTIPAGTTSRGSSAQNSSNTYTIKSGDTLSAIAAARGVSVNAIVAANGLKDQHSITAGKTLTIPAPGLSVGSSGSTKAAPKSGGLPPGLGGTPRASLQSTITSASQTYGIPGDLLHAVTWQESGWNNNVVSTSGARGIGQLMPDTIAFVNESLVSKPLDPAKPEHNIKMSAAYMRYLLNQTGGDTDTALAAYYQGLGAVQTKGVYAETHQYVRSVRALQASYFS